MILEANSANLRAQVGALTINKTHTPKTYLNCVSNQSGKKWLKQIMFLENITIRPYKKKISILFSTHFFEEEVYFQIFLD